MHLRILCIALVGIGLALFLYRWQVLDYPLTEDQKVSVWAIEAQVDIEGSGEDATIGLYVPPANQALARQQEDFVSSALTLTTQTDQMGNRAAIWSADALDGRQSVIYRALFVDVPNAREGGAQDEPPETLPDELRYPEKRESVVHSAAQTLAMETRDRVVGLEAQVDLLVEGIVDGSIGESLIQGEPDRRKVAEAVAYVLAQQDTDSRPVHGIVMADRDRSVDPVTWLEVWIDDRWQAFDTQTGDPFEPVDRLVWWRGYGTLLDVAGAEVERTSFALAERRVGAVANLSERAGLLSRSVASLSLVELSVNTQLVFETLLMIPIGALLLVVMRQVVGLETIGTFMPVLIALAFQVTDLIYGVLFFTTLVAAGLLIRFWFAQLNLLLVPRLAAMLVVVILIMIGFSLLANAVSLGLGLSVALFPIVILTMTIERMSVTWEENGPAEALKQGMGSLIVAVLAYLVMNIEALRHLIFVFPELLLIVLAAMLMLGRYSGYRLTELYRFRDLIREG